MVITQKIHTGRKNASFTDGPTPARRFAFLFLLLFLFVSVGTYVAFMVGTTVAAAERREVLLSSASLTADIAEKEAAYVALLESIDRKRASLLGFHQAEPSYVVQSSFGETFSWSRFETQEEK